ncbi:hypothetical protein [Shewanella baltica]|uniref:hypothetical protein n=1 Tax=Shewanella baltica TaxID=62322 RepID=UPI0039B106B4
MSSLIFYTDSTQALVATDTLAVDFLGQPLAFVSKAGYIPNLRTIIAGTGAGGFANRWLLDVSTRMIVKGIRNLDFHTPNALRKLWCEYKAEYSFPDDFTTTVYQFGVCEESAQIVSYAYRSTSNFESELLQYGTGVKPECNILNGNLIELVPQMMNEQREIQNTKQENERVYIGGEIFAYHLTPSGCNCSKLGEFDNFKEQQTQIFDNY